MLCGRFLGAFVVSMQVFKNFEVSVSHERRVRNSRNAVIITRSSTEACESRKFS